MKNKFSFFSGRKPFLAHPRSGIWTCNNRVIRSTNPADSDSFSYSHSSTPVFLCSFTLLISCCSFVHHTKRAKVYPLFQCSDGSGFSFPRLDGSGFSVQCLDGSGFSKLFPGIKPRLLSLEGNFWMPGFRYGRGSEDDFLNRRFILFLV